MIYLSNSSDLCRRVKKNYGFLGGERPFAYGAAKRHQKRDRPERDLDVINIFRSDKLQRNEPTPLPVTVAFSFR